MISVAEACRLVLLNTRNWGSEIIDLDQAVGRVLKETFIADRPMPPFDRVTMDGIAIRHSDYVSGVRSFKVQGIAAAGAPQMVLAEDKCCLKVMTGAILPEGVDTVIRYEDIQHSNGSFEIQDIVVKSGQNIHRKGSDRAEGETLVMPPLLIAPAEINVAATIGLSQIKVATLPRTIVISTGDELVDVDAVPMTHQIRKSNAAMIASALAVYKIEAHIEHLVDDEDELRQRLSKILKQYDLVILSGGVSAGKFDFIPKVLTELGVVCHFHKVAQRPGKPLWFGSIPYGAVVFGLPGNPVSSLVGFTKYVRLWLERSLGLKSQAQYAKLTEDVKFNKPLTYFGQVKVHRNEDGATHATPVLGKGSGDLANLLYADGFIELPMDGNEFKKGDSFPLHLFR